MLSTCWPFCLHSEVHLIPNHLDWVWVRYSCWTYGTFKRLGVPGPSPIPFFGTMLKYRKGFFHFDEESYKKYGKMWG
uniref:Uncharacterized protein n=1 Tax=Pundamilia nyererei TaxID=303518 RepID=A0A3B4GYW5_9CICH